VTTRQFLLAVCALAAVAGAFTSGDVDARATPDAAGQRTLLLGRSVDGRPITAIETGDLDNPGRTLVIGCIHGNECAGVAVAERLARTQAAPEALFWIVPNLNPDGAAAQTRGNAHRVDLNRNFPWRWQPLSGLYDSGARPLSEPESRIASALIARIRPSVSIWFHQHLNLVDDSSGNLALERRFARAAGMRLKPLTQEPGSVVTWESHCLPESSSFVVELPAGRLAEAKVRGLTRAVRLVAARNGTRIAGAPGCRGRG
jgi:protein MpaA